MTRDLTGEYEYPEDRFVLTGDWALDTWDFYAAVNYIGRFEDAPDLNGHRWTSTSARPARSMPS